MTTLAELLPKDRPLKLAGIGVPLIDFITPSEKEIRQSSRVLDELKTHLLRQAGDDSTKKHNVEKLINEKKFTVDEAVKARQEFEHFWKDEKSHKKGSKVTLTTEDSVRVAEWFRVMIDAVRVTKDAAIVLNQPPPLMVRHTGGTLYNKFHDITAMVQDKEHVPEEKRGIHISTHLLGALGDEDRTKNRRRMVENLQESGIDFHEIPDVTLGNMPVSYIIPHDGDRIILKAPFTLADKLTDKQQVLRDFVAQQKANILFIEGTDYAPGKFGAVSFSTFADAALATGKPIVFAPPTGIEMLVADAGATENDLYRIKNCHAAMNRVIDAPQTIMLTMNEAEAVAMFTGERYAPLKQPNNPEKEIAPDKQPQLQEALGAISKRLAEKTAALGPGHIPPYAFVSAGSAGSFFVTAEGHQFVPQRKAQKNVNTLGAGDAFSSGVFVEYLQQCRKLSEQGRDGFTNQELAAITNRGQELGREVVGYKGAQLPGHKIAGTALGPAAPSWGARMRNFQSTETTIGK